MNLQNISNNELVTRMEKLAHTERKIIHLVLLHILEIEDRKLYAELGYESMYAYMTQKLGYSETCAYTRIRSARLLRKVPEAAQKLEAGTLNLTQMTQIQKSIKAQEVDQNIMMSSEAALTILEKVENKNSFETQRIIAREFDLPIQIHEKLRPQKDNSVRLETTLSAEDFAELQTAQSLLSHINPNASIGEVIGYLARFHNRKKVKPKPTVMPKKAQEAFRSKPHENEIVPNCEVESKKLQVPGLLSPLATTRSFAVKAKNRAYISIHLKRSLMAKAGHCCQFTDGNSGRRCQSRHQLQIDHIRPWAVGGSDDPENLQILCRTHNDLRAREFGWGSAKFKKG